MRKRTGWALALGSVLALAGVGVAVFLMRRDLPEASAAIKGKMGLLEYKIDLAKLVTLRVGRGAESFYEQAVHRAGNVGTLADFPLMAIKTLEPEKDAGMRPILDDLIAGADTGMADDEVLDFADLPGDGPHEGMETTFLTALATLPVDAADSLARDKKYDAAIEMADAGLVFSVRLWGHGGSWPQRQAGLVGMARALAELKTIYTQTGKKALLDEVGKLEIAQAAAAKTWETKSRLTFLHSPLALHPADLLYMATHDEDEMWRVEGVKWLGVARYSGASESDREIINRHLDELEGSSDEAVAEAARRSRALTLDEVRMVPI